jgi:hypothetical protein
MDSRLLARDGSGRCCRLAVASTQGVARVAKRDNENGMTEPLWWLTKDGDKDCLALYERHYSAYRYKDGRKRRQFVGPGESIVLRTLEGDAMFVWRKFVDNSGQQGVNCAVFRNESKHKSSELIRQADAIADLCWPGERHYTYVNAEKVRSANPGYCFVRAGWRRCGRTKVNNLLILEKLTADPAIATPGKL